MNRYMEFRTDRFLMDSRHWESKRQELVNELDELAELHSASGGGKPTRPSDSVGTAVCKREHVQKEIDHLDQYIHAYTYAWKHLSELHRAVLSEVMLTDSPKLHAVDNFAQNNGMCVNEVYKLRREAIEAVHDLLCDLYDGI